MFKELGKSFLDIFKSPLILISALFSVVLGIILMTFVVGYTFEYINLGQNFYVLIMSLILNNLWVFVLYLALFLLFNFVASLFIALIVNKKLNNKDKFKGSFKIFGFSLFLSLIIYLPMFIFSIFSYNLFVNIVMMLFYLFYFFVLIPSILFVPILLVNNDIKSSILKSYKFSRKHYWSILALFLLFTFVLMISDYLLNTLFFESLIAPVIYLFLFLIIAFLAIYFLYNWFYSE